MTKQIPYGEMKPHDQTNPLFKQDSALQKEPCIVEKLNPYDKTRPRDKRNPLIKRIGW